MLRHSIAVASLTIFALGFGPCDKVSSLLGKKPAGAASSLPVASASAPAAPQSVEEKALADALDLCQKGDCKTGYDRLKILLPPNAPLRRTKSFQQLEQRWAEEAVRGALNDYDTATRRRTLEEVIATESLPADLRARASATLEKLPEPEESSDEPASAVVENALAWEEAFKTPIETESRLTEAKQASRKKPQEAIRMLFPRVATGMASPDERKLLRDLCAKQNDLNCAGRVDMLSKGDVDGSVIEDAREAMISGNARQAKQMIEPRADAKVATVEELLLLRAACIKLKDSVCANRARMLAQP